MDVPFIVSAACGWGEGQTGLPAREEGEVEIRGTDRHEAFPLQCGMGKRGQADNLQTFCDEDEAGPF